MKELELNNAEKCLNNVLVEYKQVAEEMERVRNPSILAELIEKSQDL